MTPYAYFAHLLRADRRNVGFVTRRFTQRVLRSLRSRSHQPWLLVVAPQPIVDPAFMAHLQLFAASFRRSVLLLIVGEAAGGATWAPVPLPARWGRLEVAITQGGDVTDLTRLHVPTLPRHAALSEIVVVRDHAELLQLFPRYHLTWDLNAQKR